MRLLCTIPGVQARTAQVILAEIGADMTVFPTDKHLASWALIVRAHGAVQSTPAHGTLLGAVDDPAFVTCQVTLEPGDAIVLCSDGIHDTEIDAVRVDEQRVSELLAGTPLDE